MIMCVRVCLCVFVCVLGDFFSFSRVFNKVKSRSAHMKSHRPPDADAKKPKLDPHKLEAAEQTLARTLAVTSTISRHHP